MPDAMSCDPQTILGAFSTGDARNGWVYLSISGWIKVGGDTDSAHASLFAELLAAKSAGAPVRAYIEHALLSMASAA